jgi:hypothetical protein
MISGQKQTEAKMVEFKSVPLLTQETAEAVHILVQNPSKVLHVKLTGNG